MTSGRPTNFSKHIVLSETTYRGLIVKNILDKQDH